MSVLSEFCSDLYTFIRHDFSSGSALAASALVFLDNDCFHLVSLTGKRIDSTPNTKCKKNFPFNILLMD